MEGNLSKNALLFSIMAVLAFAGCKGGNDKVIAKIGTEKIRLSDVRERLKDMPENYSKYIESEVGQKQIVDLLVKEKVLLEEAKRAGIPGRKEIAKDIKDFKDNFAKQLKQYEENLYVSTLLGDLQEKELMPGEDKLKAYYEENKKQFTGAVETQVSHILVSTADEAKDVLRRLRSGEKFEKLAAELSIDPSSNSLGGKLGKYRQGELLPEFEAPVSRLKVGEVSDVIYTSFGYHVVKKTAEKKLAPQSYEDAKKNIQKLLVKKMFDKWIDEKKARLKVKVNYGAMKTIAETGTAAKEPPKYSGGN
jgi:foldase protein PrsA